MDDASRSAAHDPHHEGNTVNLAELAGKVVDTHPGIPSTMASQVIRTALKAIREEIEGAPEGVVSVPLLGQFRVRNVETEKDGQKSQVRRTLFVAPRAKPAVEGAAAPAAKAAPTK